MTIAASNNVPQLLTQLVEEGSLKAEHRRRVLEMHKERRGQLSAKFNGKIWHASSAERRTILTGTLAIEVAKESGLELDEAVISQALHRQQLARVRAAQKDVTAAMDGDEPRFEFWVANLRQSMFEKPNHDDRMVAIGDLAREMAVLAAHNPKTQATIASHLVLLEDVLEKIHFHEDEAIIKKELHTVLDSLGHLAREGHIAKLEVYNEEGHKVSMKPDDLMQFINDTRFLATV